MTLDQWRNQIVCGDALQVLKQMPDGCIHSCVTSPPYWGLRTYGIEGQLGLEKTPEEYIANMVEVFREVKRVLRDDAVLWLNMGDSYAGSGKAQGQKPEHTNIGKRQDDRPYDITHWIPVPQGLKPKDLCGIPWRLALALQADGWWLRMDNIWSKPNPMPESVTDRPTKAHEYVFLLTKSARYFYDQEAVREPLLHKDGFGTYGMKHVHQANPQYSHSGRNYNAQNYDGRNLRSVWTFPTKGFSGLHFATFPPELPRRCILAGTSEKGCCPECGAPWERVVKNKRIPIKHIGNSKYVDTEQPILQKCKKMEHYFDYKWRNESQTLGFRPTCSCGHKETVPCVVLDPFAGRGTTGEVAIGLGRDYVLIDLNPVYIDELAKPAIEKAEYMRKQRLAQEELFAKGGRS